MPDFLEQLKAMMGGGSPKPTVPQDDLNEAEPWNSPSLQTAAPVAPMEPSGPPPEAPMSPMEDAIQQAVRLERQRKLASRLIPQQMWNK
jgi:hypothetical protein